MLEEKNLVDSFEISHWSTPKSDWYSRWGSFSGVTAYLVETRSCYLNLGTLLIYLEWQVNGHHEVNAYTSATTGATASTGFIFTFQFSLAKSENISDEALINHNTELEKVNCLLELLHQCLQVSRGMYFIFQKGLAFEDPPFPGFETALKMLDIASDVVHWRS